MIRVYNALRVGKIIGLFIVVAGGTEASAETLQGLQYYKPLYAAVQAHHGHDNFGQIKLHGGFKYDIGTDRKDLPFSNRLTRAIGKSCNNLFFAYSMISFWDFQDESGPFEDINHNPEIFCEGTHTGYAWLDEHIAQWGYEHLSNGIDNVSISQDGVTRRSRSIHNLNAVFGLYENSHSRLSAKLWWNFRKSENPDIDDYWGHVDIRFLHASGYTNSRQQHAFQWSIQLRGSPVKGRGRLLADISYRLPDRIGFKNDMYLFAQIFQGYGDSLLNYNKETTTLRLGFQLMRDPLPR
ncbi:MAG: hypothetical protein D6698_17210 [Gammaproteobacteria bacterium]|nr:MAG: hypothetical protein D6698_17210 [Gammaproteobacteria bacterium]